MGRTLVTSKKDNLQNRKHTMITLRLVKGRKFIRMNMDGTDSGLYSIVCLWQDSRNGGKLHVLLPQCWLTTVRFSLEARVSN